MDEFLKFMVIMLTMLLGIGLGMITIADGNTTAFLGTLAFTFGILTMVILSDTIKRVATSRASDESEDTDKINPVQKLQDKYVDGKISEEEFENKLDKLADSQDVAESIDDENFEISEEIDF